MSFFRRTALRDQDGLALGVPLRDVAQRIQSGQASYWHSGRLLKRHRLRFERDTFPGGRDVLRKATARTTALVAAQ